MSKMTIKQLPEMRYYKTLSGDVNWRDYGTTLYRSGGYGIYYLIEFVNMDDATGSIEEGKYLVIGKVIDISEEGSSLKNIDCALSCIGIDGSQRDVLTLLEAINAYGSYDEVFHMFGNNAYKLLSDAKRRL